MPSLNDTKHNALLALLGETGKPSLNSLEWRWLSDLTGLTLSIHDMWNALLTSQGIAAGSLQDRQREWWKALGYTGENWNELAFQFWENGGFVGLPEIRPDDVIGVDGLQSSSSAFLASTLTLHNGSAGDTVAIVFGVKITDGSKAAIRLYDSIAGGTGIAIDAPNNTIKVGGVDFTDASWSFHTGARLDVVVTMKQGAPNYTEPTVEVNGVAGTGAGNPTQSVGTVERLFGNGTAGGDGTNLLYIQFMQASGDQVRYLVDEGSGATLTPVDAGDVATTPVATLQGVDGTAWVWRNVTTMMYEYETTGAAESITLPLVSGQTYNFTIKWGDGGEDTITAWDQAEATHEYAVAGTYLVEITGAMPRLQHNNGTEAPKVRRLEYWGDTGLNTGELMWYGCSGMTHSPRDIPNSRSWGKTSSMFRECDILNFDAMYWDLANIQWINAMFQDSIAFDGETLFLFGSRLNGSTAFNSTFRGCTAYTGKGLENWNVAAGGTGRGMNSMFRDCPNFNGNIDGWDTVRITQMEYAFRGCSAFNRDISGWNVSNVTKFREAFRDCVLFNADISGWDVSAVNASNGFRGTFWGCSIFNQNIGLWDAHLVGNCHNMMTNCTAFDQDCSGWDVSGAGNMHDIFNNTGISTANYDAILNGYAAQTVQSGINFGANGLTYSATGETGRNTLVNAPNLWNITGDSGPV